MVDKEDLNITIGEEQNTGDGVVGSITDILVAYKGLISLLIISTLGYVIYTGTDISIDAPVWVINVAPFLLGGIIFAYMIFPRVQKWIPSPQFQFIFQFHIEGISKAKESDKVSSFLNIGFAKVSQKKFSEEWEVEGHVFQKKNFIICESFDIENQEVIGAELAELSSWELIAYRKKLAHTRDEMLDELKDAKGENVVADAEKVFEVFESMQMVINKLAEETSIDEESIAEIFNESGLEDTVSEFDNVDGGEATVQDMMEMVSDDE